jgi:threonine synthase
MWRYRELLPLPIEEAPVTLGEPETPILAMPKTARRLGLEHLWVKDEGRLPNESFKARGMAMAVSMARHFGVTKIALPSAGNAAGAASAYGARAGIETCVFVPKDTPAVNIAECRLHGARVELVDGLISDCGRIVAERQAAEGWFSVATLNQPYRIEGKKTMGLELADQFGEAAGLPPRTLPDAILYPTGGGTGLIAMVKVFRELNGVGSALAVRASGKSKGSSVASEVEERLPRMYSIQADGCAPIVRAFEAGARHATMFPNAATAASGLRVPASIGDFLMLDAIRSTGGKALVGRETSIREWMRIAAGEDGICLCPESAIVLDGLATLVRDGDIRPAEQVLLFNTASALKYAEVLPTD